METVASEYGEHFLSKLGLPLNQGPTAFWPVSLLTGSAYGDQAIANLLVLNVIFPSLEKYIAVFNEIPENVVSNSGEELTGCFKPRPLWTRSLIKDLLRSPSIIDVATKHGIGDCTLRRYIKLHPDLAFRRKNAIRSHKIRESRRVLTRFLESNPKSSRGLFEKAELVTYKMLMRNDREWFDQVLPSRFPQKIKSKVKNGNPRMSI
jgi:hypothetical protein